MEFNRNKIVVTVDAQAVLGPADSVIITVPARARSILVDINFSNGGKEEAFVVFPEKTEMTTKPIKPGGEFLLEQFKVTVGALTPIMVDGKTFLFIATKG